MRTLLVRVVEQGFQRRSWTDVHINLIGKSTPPAFDQKLVQPQNCAREPIVAERQRKRCREAPNLSDLKPGLFEQSTQRSKGEQSRVRNVEDTTFIISTGNVAFLIARIMLLLGQFNYGKRGILGLHCSFFQFIDKRLRR